MTLDDSGATFCASTVQVRHDSGSVDAEAEGELVDRDASLVHGVEVVHEQDDEGSGVVSSDSDAGILSTTTNPAHFPCGK